MKPGAVIGPQPSQDSIAVLVVISGLEQLQNDKPEMIEDLIEARCRVAAAHLRHMARGEPQETQE